MKNQGFKTFGVMIDMSRNAVMSVGGLKRYLPLLKKMGYNTVMLYTEDTYEIEGEPYFGYMRGRYSKQELCELDAFAQSIGIELIPCVQTLAHLNQAVRWNVFPVDTGDIMLTDDERTYTFIDKMLKSLSETFKSRRIHVGMDEAAMLGRGKHTDLFGYEEGYSIIKRHVKRVKQIAEKYGYEIMIWSDMYFRTWNKNHDYYVDEKVKLPDEVISAYDPDIIPVYWDYYHHEEEIYDAMFYNHSQLSDKTWFAGGVWTWKGFLPSISFSLKTMLPAIRSAKRNGIENFIMTMWGDAGGECSMFSALPGLHYLAEYSRGNTDEESIKRKFKSYFGVDYDDFLLLEAPNRLFPENEKDKYNPINPTKYMLYSDVFNGVYDYTVTAGDGEKFAPIAKKLSDVAKKTRKYGYLFKTASKLCELLSVKYDLGVKTRAAYKSGDKAELLRLANEEYKDAIRLMREFGDVYEKQWFYDNKTIGFDVQDLRIGGAERRLSAARRRLLDYALGKIELIEELECEILPVEDVNAGQPISLNFMEKMFTQNVI